MICSAEINRVDACQSAKNQRKSQHLILLEILELTLAVNLALVANRSQNRGNVCFYSSATAPCEATRQLLALARVRVQRPRNHFNKKNIHL